MAKTAIQEMIMVLMGLLVIGMTSASAQTASLGPGEISCTTADSLSDIWFRHLSHAAPPHQRHAQRHRPWQIQSVCQ